MKKFFWAFVFTIFACQAHAECQFNNKTYEVIGKDCPKDVADIVERIYGCNYLGGEPYDLNEEFGRQRKRSLDKQIRELRCEVLESEQKTIKQKYKNNLQILDFLKDSEELKGF